MPALRFITQCAQLPRRAWRSVCAVALHNITVRRHLQGALLAFALAAGHGITAAQPLDVMHWWTSTSERSAADQLAAAFAAQGLQWEDAAVPGGGGVAAMKVLKSRVISGDAPAAAQVIGKTLTDWADLGLVLPLDAVAQRGRWAQVLFPTVLDVVTHGDRVIAAPIGVHRGNVLVWQRRLFTRLGLAEPKRWADIEAAAVKLRAAGIRPIAWSDEPWQVATVFEAVLLAEAGAPLYRELVTARNPQAWDDVRVERALARLRWLHDLNGPEPKSEPGWTDTTRALFNQQAGMLLNGDWVKGELMAWGARPDADFGCTPVPGTRGVHLYSIDTLAMLAGPAAQKPTRQATQEKAAEILTSVATQRAYNRIKGAVPVRQDADTAGMDLCALDSFTTFSDRRAERVPSLAHRMAADDATKDAIADAVQRFLMNPATSPADARRRLVAVVRSVLAGR